MKLTGFFLVVFALGASVQFISRPNEPSAKIVPLTLSKTRWLSDPNSTNTVDGDSGTENRMTLGVRSDGSTVEIAYFDNAEGASSEIRHIVDYRRGLRIVLESSTKSMMSMPMASDRNSDGASGRPGWCGGLEVETTMHGFAVARRTFDAESFRYVNFHAPDLGCILLESRVFKLLDEANNEYQLIQEDRVESITLGEPDSSLFMPEEGYVERSPKELAIRMAEVGGRDIDQALLGEDPFVRRAEENYRRLRE